MENNFDKWIAFLYPEKLKDNLIFCFLFIAVYESFKDYVVEEVKFFFHMGADQTGDIFSSRYKTSVLDKDKNTLNATLLWLLELGAIGESDIERFQEIRKHRNRLTHEMMECLLEGMPKELPECLADLFTLRIKIEKWWVLNIEIPTNPDYDSSSDIREEDIMTSSQIIYRIIMDMLSGDNQAAAFYRDEFIKFKNSHYNKKS